MITSGLSRKLTSFLTVPGPLTVVFDSLTTIVEELGCCSQPYQLLTNVLANLSRRSGKWLYPSGSGFSTSFSPRIPLTLHRSSLPATFRDTIYRILPFYDGNYRPLTGSTFEGGLGVFDATTTQIK
jgi:hypothetical protein